MLNCCGAKWDMQDATAWDPMVTKAGGFDRPLEAKLAKCRVSGSQVERFCGTAEYRWCLEINGCLFQDCGRLA